MLSRRVTGDLKLTPLVFDVCRLRLTPLEARSLWEKLDAIHEHRHPPDDDLTRMREE
jgi:hypothetical protein